MGTELYDIGIDLGTTFSVVAVKGEVQVVDGYPRPTYLAECDVTIIPTPDGDATFPSVFWVDPADASRVLVGIEAKQKAEEGDAPIVCSKRSIGTNQPLKIHDRTFAAKEVATRILEYLKNSAEQALGRPIRRAVVTHPAYFKPNQVQETREAAMAAGLDVSLPDQVMMEPAAAALAYTIGVEKDPLRVMTYDLGGGTFDVTVLERSGGVITMKGFDGNPLLGGYNFDRELVQWVLERLKSAGRNIPYDDANPVDRGRRARLLQLAESVKIKLTEQRSDRVFVDVRGPDILVDADGKKVQILERINRLQYTELIKDHLLKTIRCCHRALAKAGMKGDDLDAILLVGGSTYGQWVCEAVEKAFGKNVEPYNPDLCVAAGAAIQAAELPAVSTGEGIELVLDVPAVSSLPTINVAGTLRREDGTALSEAERNELKVLLETPEAGALDPCSPDAEGRFLFADVELLDEEPSAFEIHVADGNSLTRLKQPFAVEYVPGGGGATEIYSVLPRPIYLRTKDGMRLVAEEGVPLPAKCEIRRPRVHGDSSLDIEIFQENEKISTIDMGDIPADAGKGSQVVVTVEITQKNEMKGVVQVLAQSGSVAAERPVEIKFPPLVLPGLPKLRADYEDLESQREQLAALSNDPQQRLELAGKASKVSKGIQKLLDEQQPDVHEVYAALKELDSMVHPPEDDMEPTRGQFRELVEVCHDMLNASSDPQLQPLQNVLGRIEKEGGEAYTTRNRKRWAKANENLIKLYGRLQKVGEAQGGGGPDPEPVTWEIKERARQEAAQLRTRLEERRDQLQSHPKYASKIQPRLEEIEKLLDQYEREVEKIDDDLDGRQSNAKVQQARRPIPRIHQGIEHADVDI